ncbi:MAG: Uma2 family endonuclease [Bryobacter sp.]|nr:Uma2 family endonuclease [Bryobacter sp.]
MATTARPQIAPRISLDQYLFDEAHRPDKHEFHAGYVYAMAGGSLSHAAMCANAVSALVRAVGSKRCLTLTADIKVWVEAEGSAVYPDAAVVCGKAISHKKSEHMITNPIVIVEVLSPSTRDYDLGKKFLLYRQLLSLQEYLLIEPDEVYVIHYSKDAKGAWRKKTHQLTDAVIELPSIKASLALRDLYPNA